MTRPSHPATLYLSAPEMIRLVRRLGLPACIAGVAERIEPRLPALGRIRQERPARQPFRLGVIELMPIADAAHLRLQVRQRPSGQHRARACPR